MIDFNRVEYVEKEETYSLKTKNTYLSTKVSETKFFIKFIDYPYVTEVNSIVYDEYMKWCKENYESKIPKGAIKF